RTEGSAASMPATATTASAAATRSAWASSRCRPATPTSTITSGSAPKTLIVAAHSCTTGRSDVPAATTATSPRKGRGGPRAAHPPANGIGLHPRQARLARPQRVPGQPGGQDLALGVSVVKSEDGGHHLVARFPRAVHDLGVAGPGRPVEVQAREPEVSDAWG